MGKRVGVAPLPLLPLPPAVPRSLQSHVCCVTIRYCRFFFFNSSSDTRGHHARYPTLSSAARTPHRMIRFVNVQEFDHRPTTSGVMPVDRFENESERCIISRWGKRDLWRMKVLHSWNTFHGSYFISRQGKQRKNNINNNNNPISF